MGAVLAAAVAARAQDALQVPPPTIPPAVSAPIQPSCARVVNQAPHTVIGSIATDYYVNEDGIKARHRSNFRLAPSESASFCTTGPFYPGQKVELVLRTMFPIFSCMTAITGDIVIHEQQNADGTRKLSAVCLN